MNQHVLRGGKARLYKFALFSKSRNAAATAALTPAAEHFGPGLGARRLPSLKMSNWPIGAEDIAGEVLREWVGDENN